MLLFIIAPSNKMSKCGFKLNKIGGNNHIIVYAILSQQREQDTKDAVSMDN